MSLTVKAYLTRFGHQQPEIRRFGVDADATSNYNYLVGKIHAVFPGLVNTTFTLSWRDAENDLIVFSSDEELTEALGYVNDGVFKIYIDEKQREGCSVPPPCHATPPPCSQEGEFPGRCGPRRPGLHRRVVCDGCNGPVVGIRYKCEVCEDYDLCEGCKGKGLHPEHTLKAIEKPLRWGGRCGFGREMPPGAECRFMMPPMMQFPSFPHPHPQQFGGPGMTPPFGGPGMPPPFGGPGGMSVEEMRAQRRAWRRWYREAFRGDAECRKAEKRCRREEKKRDKKMKKNATKKDEGEMEQNDMNTNEEEKKKAEAGKDGSDSSTSSSSSDEDEGQATGSPTESYLKNVGQSVAAMLDPLGIEVEVDVEHHGRRNRCQKPGMGAGWGGMGGGWGGWHGMRGRHGGHWGGGFRQGRGGFGPCNWAGSSAWPQHPFPAQHCDAAQASAASQPATGVNVETGEMRNTESIPATACGPSFRSAGEAERASESSPETAGWTFVAPTSIGADLDGATRGVEGMSVSEGTGAAAAASASDSRTDMSLSNPAHAEAVNNLMSMGFTNQGGWLTALVTSHNGDLNAVLDYLKGGAVKK